MASASAAVAVLGQLQVLGFCADLNIPDAAAATSEPSEVFDAILARFLREAYPGKRPLPAALGDGRRIDLLRLFATVHASGGYRAVSSWAAAAGSAGLDVALAAPVKLLYAQYLGALDLWVQRLLEADPSPPSVGRKEQLFMDCNGTEQQQLQLQQHVVLKRKREDMVGMLGWVRDLAENARDEGIMAAGSADGYLSMLLVMRQAVVGKRARRASVANGVLLQGIGGCECCRSTTSARMDVQCSRHHQLVVQYPGSGTNELTALTENMNGSSVVLELECSLNGQSNHGYKKHQTKSDGLDLTSKKRNAVPVGSKYQAEVPEWTGVVPENYDDPETSKWLGTKLWPLENENREAPCYSDPIGKGRDDVCVCNIPGSVECVRFHIAEKGLQLRRELGSAFYSLGFDGMGEEVALSWTGEEEAKFKDVMQIDAPSSGRNIWNRLQLAFPSKPRKELVSYYFNCFLLRRRCYQNRITPKKIDSDDEEETEFRFLGNRLGQSATNYHSTKHTVCVENTHCMDLDQ